MAKFNFFRLTILCFIILTACQNTSLPFQENILATSTPAEKTSPAVAATEVSSTNIDDVIAEETDNQAQALPMSTFAPITTDVGLIKIGYMGPLTGGAAFVGTEQIAYVETVVEMYRQQTGLDVEIIMADTEINPETGTAIAQNFADDPDIVGVIGPAGSQVCEATQPIFRNAGLAHITPSCTKTDLTDPGTPTFFRPIPTDADQSKAIAAHMIAASNI